MLSVNGCKKSCKLSNLKVKLLKNVVDLSVGFAILLGVLLAIPISMIVIGKFTWNMIIMHYIYFGCNGVIIIYYNPSPGETMIAR